MERQPDRWCFMRFCANRLQTHAFRRRKHDWTGSFTAESNASSVNRAMPASDSTRWYVRGVVTLVVSGDARPIAALCRAPLAPTAFLQEEQHATRRAAEAKSLALWTTEQVDTRSCHDRERGVRSILGYLDNLAVGPLVDPIQSIPVWCGRTELVHQSHGCGCRRMAIHQRAQQVADRAAQRSKLIQPMGGHRAYGPRERHVVDAEPGEEVRGCGEPVAHLAIDREDGADELECQRTAPERVVCHALANGINFAKH
jgi:hypothetical protein